MGKLTAFISSLVFGLPAASVQSAEGQCAALVDHELRLLGQEETRNLCQDFSGKLLLIVNTASRCAFTPQYDGLEALYERYKDQGLVVLGFPSNDFGGQEPGTEKEIKSFCELTYNVKFPMFEKVHVVGDQATPLYKQLAEISGKVPRWNFHKYLIAPDGTYLDSFGSMVSPKSRKLISRIEANLPGASADE